MYSKSGISSKYLKSGVKCGSDDGAVVVFDGSVVGVEGCNTAVLQELGDGYQTVWRKSR